MYQLVLQFSAAVVDYDDLLSIEDELVEALTPPTEVDGHDFGRGQGNIFILTDNPVATFERLLPVLRRLSRDCDATVAYRAVQGEQYTAIWPEGFNGKFSVA